MYQQLEKNLPKTDFKPVYFEYNPEKLDGLEQLWDLGEPTGSGESEIYIIDSRGTSNERWSLSNYVHIGVFQDAIERIESFKNLEVDWDSYDAMPPNEDTIKIALHTLKELKRYLNYPTRINPSAAGGITFEFLKDNNYYVLEFYNDGDIAFLEQIDGRSTAIDISPQDIKEVISKII